MSLLSLLKRDVVEASPALLGAIVVHGPMRARIVEVEAYRGLDDPACHAFGKTKMKNMALYEEPGRAYVYLNYGMHWMLNVVAHEPGDAAAVLIRAAEPLAGIDLMKEIRGTNHLRNLLSGPGKLTKAMSIDSRHNGLPLFQEEVPPQTDLYILPAESPVTNVITGPRIGIAHGKWHDIPWRFLDGDALEWVSRPLPPRT
jgi:DNA-3-methyladenine glycosylase